MMSPEFDLQAGGSTGPDGMDMDGGSSEESGPSTSALSDSAALYPHSHSVSPGGRDDTRSVTATHTRQQVSDSDTTCRGRVNAS